MSQPAGIVISVAVNGFDNDQRCQFLVFDVETTGLGNYCKVVEFAALILDPNGTPTGSYETLVDPGANPGPTRIHGITASMLVGAPSFRDVAGDVQRLFRGRVPVAHNLRFDWTALRNGFDPLGVELPAWSNGICTARLSRRVFPGVASLTALCRRLGIDYPMPHRAGPDVAATAAVLQAVRSVEPKLLQGRPCQPFTGFWKLPLSVPPLPRAAVVCVTSEKGAFR